MKLYLDIAGGISGDMLMATLLGLGVQWQEFEKVIKTLPIHEEFDIELNTMMKGSIAGLKANVLLRNPPASHEESHHDHSHSHEHTHRKQGQEHHHRGLTEINHIIQDARISDRAKELSRKVFLELAQAEAQVHGTSIEEVHFHEVGAVDSIVDIVGCCVLIDMLQIDQVYYNSLPLGGGQVETEHGIMPVPAPATLKLMEGMKVRVSPAEGELVTPTGAALLRGLDAKVLIEQEMEILRSAIGCGQKEFRFPNILRGMLFQSKAENHQEQKLTILECNIDDMTGEMMAEAISYILEQGALDAWIVPIIMKKGRPAYMLKALVETQQYEEMIEVIFDCTTTIGVRAYEVVRVGLRREEKTLDTSYGEVKFKKTIRKDGRTSIKPEFDDLKKIALSKNTPVLEIQRRILHENNI